MAWTLAVPGLLIGLWAIGTTLAASLAGRHIDGEEAFGHPERAIVVVMAAGAVAVLSIVVRLAGLLLRR